MATAAEHKLSEHLRQGDLLRTQGRQQEAEAEYRAAVELDHTHEDAHYKLFDLYTEMGREEEAFRELEFVSAVEPTLDQEEHPPFLSETEIKDIHPEPEYDTEQPTVIHSRPSESFPHVQDGRRTRSASITVPIQDEPWRRTFPQETKRASWRQWLLGASVVIGSAVLTYTGWELLVEAPRQRNQLAKQDIPSPALPPPATEEAAVGEKEVLQDTPLVPLAETAAPPASQPPQPDREPQSQPQPENAQSFPPKPEPQPSRASLPPSPPTSSTKKHEGKKSSPHPLAQEEQVATQQVPTHDEERTEELPLGKYLVLRDTRLFSEPDLDTAPVAWLRKGTKVNVVGRVGPWLKVESRYANRVPGYLRRYDAEAIRE